LFRGLQYCIIPYRRVPVPYLKALLLCKGFQKLLSIEKTKAVLRIPIRDPVLLLTPGSGMEKIRIRDGKNPDPG
jgi:hypothetical protein